MDRVMLEQHRAMLEQRLAEAEAHVAWGERHVAWHRDLVARLERDGHDSADERQVLADFEKLYAARVATRDQLRQELAALPTP